MDILSSLTTPLATVVDMPLSIGDLLGFSTGILCVWLTARANVWNFPIGILNSAILGLVFFQQRLFADASLQIVFIALSMIGWWRWIAGRHAKETSPVFGTSAREQVVLVGVAAITALVLWYALIRLKGASPPVDALVTALSLCAQWQLNRRQISSWAWWIVVDLISIPLYWGRELPLIACLYVIFLFLCLGGCRRWQSLTLWRLSGETA